MKKNDSIILSSLKEVEKKVKNTVEIPAGYIPVNLSTKGKIYAPAEFHIRNFKMSEILTLSMLSTQDITLKLPTILNGMIYEDVDTNKWTEQEVEETMLQLFITFYKQSIEIDYQFSNEELQQVKELRGEEIYKSIVNGQFKPKTIVNILKDVSTYDLPDDFEPKIKISKKDGSFYCIFDFMRYGDQLIIKEWVDNYYSKEEQKYKKLVEQIKFNQTIEAQLKYDPEKVDNLIYINPQEKEEFDNYVARRIETIYDITRLVSICNVNGEDVSNLSLTEKYDKLSNDARIDYGMINALNEVENKCKFGLNPNVQMVNPITKGVVVKPLTFQIPTIIQSIVLCDPTEYDNGYTVENVSE